MLQVFSEMLRCMAIPATMYTTIHLPVMNLGYSYSRVTRRVFAQICFICREESAVFCMYLVIPIGLRSIRDVILFLHVKNFWFTYRK